MSEIEHNNRPFQSSFRLQTHRPSSRSALLVAHKDPKQQDATTTTSVPSEARYWAEKFGLGANTSYPRSRGKYAHPRAVTLECGTSASFVHQIVVGATATANTSQQRQRAPHQLLAAVCGPRVPLFGVTPQSEIHKMLAMHSLAYDTTRKVAADRHVSTGGQLALSAALRSDGRLLAIGTASGTIRVADTTTRATLCQFSSSTTTTTANGSSSSNLAIRSVAWFRDGQHFMSAGDDGVVRVWALKSTSNNNKALLELRGHGDSIRCAVLWQGETASSNGSRSVGSLVASGGYDHTVRIWDVENIVSDSDDHKNSQDNSNNERCRFVLQHGAPVEALLWISSTALQAEESTHSTSSTCPIWLVSAGGTSLKVWNPVTGRCVCTLQAQHRKSITSLLQLPRVNREEDETTPTQQRLVTGGLDGLLRIHNWNAATGQLQYLHGVRVENGSVGITALAATTAGDRIAIGTTAGTVLVRQMGPSGPQRKRTSSGPRAGTYAFFTRGMNADPTAGDHVVYDEHGNSNKRRKPLQPFDVALQQFRYGDALDAALETRQPLAVAAVLEELGRRPCGLTIALSNRDEESLEPVLAFTARYIARPRYSALLIGVANHLLDIYGDVAGESETMDELLNKLKNQVSTEVKTQTLLWRIVGQLDSVLTEAERLER